MAIAQDLLVAVALTVFCLAFACAGSLILRWLSVEIERDVDHLLVCVGVGLVTIEVLLFLAQFSKNIRGGVLLVLCLLLVPLTSESKIIMQRVRTATLALYGPRSAVDALLLLMVLVVLCIEYLTSMAPLVGSDAMHYHFTVQKLILLEGFHPFFSNSHSFLCGQHHLLILLGLALGSEKLALGLIFIGGVLSVAVLANLASRWTSERVVLGICLIFLLTPVVFWQISSSGAPDIYIAFFTGLVITVFESKGNRRQALVAGLLTGGIAGAKYTGCLVAAAAACAFIVEFPTVSRLAVFVAGSVISGVWPYLRNAVWTRDPVFPFLADRVVPRLVTNYGLTYLAKDTGAATHHNLAGLFPFLFFAAANRDNVGFWDFFGPTVLAVAPLIFLAFKNVRLWRVAFVIWFLAAIEIFFASGLTRFLLPLFPIALLCTAGGIEWSSRKNWALVKTAALSTIVFVAILGFGGLLVYCEPAVLAGVGITPRQEYLKNRAQDYEVVEAINQMQGKSHQLGSTLVFLRHLYYLRVPYVNGDPATSFEVDPERLKTPDAWKRFLKEKGIGYVVRAPDYPDPIAPPLEQLEKRGDLVISHETEVGNIVGMRTTGDHSRVAVIVLKVAF